MSATPLPQWLRGVVVMAGNADELISRAMRTLAIRRSPEQAKKTASAGGKAYWAKLNEEESKAEMKRRAQVRAAQTARGDKRESKD